MGSQTIIDLIASTLVFGFLLLMTIRLNVSTTENMQMYREDLLVQQNLVEVTKLLEYDLRKIAYCKNFKKIPDPSQAIRYASDSCISFWTDVDNDGNIDSLKYYVGSPTSASALATPNPNDRLLYRVVNNQTAIGVNLGVTEFKFKYFDANRDSLAIPMIAGDTTKGSPGEIQYMQISVQVESFTKNTMAVNMAAYDTLYQTAYWRQLRLVAKNLGNH